jgi:hypothetical protein
MLQLERLGRKRRLAALVLSGVMVCAGALVAGSTAQAATAPVGVNALPALWSDYGQHIVNYHSGKCLQPQSTAPQARIEQRTCTSPSSLQRWKVIDSGDGHAMLVNQGSGLCLDLFVNSEAEVALGTPVQQFSCWNGYTSEYWKRSRGSRYEYFQVLTRIKNLCLDVRDRSSSDGAPLQLWTCDFYEVAQEFKFVDATW